MSTETATALENELADQLHEMRTTLAAVNETGSRIGTMVLWLIGGAFALGGWVAIIEFRQQADDSVRAKVESLELWKARNDGLDSPKILDGMRASLSDQNSRLQRVEVKMESIDATLDRIESSLIRQHQAATNPGGKP